MLESLLKQLIGLYQQLLEKLKSEKPILSTPPLSEPPTKPVDPPKYNWSTRADARHSSRVICDEEGLNWGDKNILCSVIQEESGFDINARRENLDKNGKVWSTDWGICQINDYYWIGAGKTFKSIEEVLTQPEKSIRFMIKMYKAGKLSLWVAYKTGAYKKHLM